MYQPRDNSKVQCYNFQEFGHYAAECKNPHRERNHEANLTQQQNDHEPTLMLASQVYDEVYLNEEKVNPKLRSSEQTPTKSKV